MIFLAFSLLLIAFIVNVPMNEQVAAFLLVPALLMAVAGFSKGVERGIDHRRKPLQLLGVLTGYRGLSGWFERSFLERGDEQDKDEIARYARQKDTVDALSMLLVVGLWAAVAVFSVDLLWGDKAIVNQEAIDAAASGEKVEPIYEAQMGPFGDFFAGVINPIFTFLTFFGLVVTIVLQRVELGATLTELKLTRDEMTKSSKSLQKQADASVSHIELIEQQKFETTLFKLLDIMEKRHNELLSKGAMISKSVFPSESLIEEIENKLFTSDSLYLYDEHDQYSSLLFCLENILKIPEVNKFIVSFVTLVDFIRDHKTALWVDEIICSVVDDRVKACVFVLVGYHYRDCSGENSPGDPILFGTRKGVSEFYISNFFEPCLMLPGRFKSIGNGFKQFTARVGENFNPRFFRGSTGRLLFGINHIVSDRDWSKVEWPPKEGVNADVDAPDAGVRQ